HRTLINFSLFSSSLAPKFSDLACSTKLSKRYYAQWHAVKINRTIASGPLLMPARAQKLTVGTAGPYIPVWRRIRNDRGFCPLSLPCCCPVDERYLKSWQDLAYFHY